VARDRARATLLSAGGFYEKTLVPLLGWAVNKTARGATSLVAVVVWGLALLGLTLLLFLTGVLMFILVTRLLSSEWCSDHSIATAIPEGAVSAIAFVTCLYLLSFNPHMPGDVKHALLLYLGALCAALGLRCITRMLATDGRWYTVVIMRYADLCEVCTPHALRPPLTPQALRPRFLPHTVLPHPIATSAAAASFISILPALPRLICNRPSLSSAGGLLRCHLLPLSVRLPAARLR
jgi:hypothetical protein